MSAAPLSVRPAPSAELRTSLGLASLAAALVHLMGPLHGGPAVSFAAAALLGGLAALLAFTRSRTALAPAIAFNAVLAVGLPALLAVPAQLAVLGGALALLWGAGDRTLTIWSKLAFATFALAALSGFGHLGH